MSFSLGVLGVVKYGGPGCTELRTFWTAKDAKSPQWIIDALTAMHATFPEGQLLRYHSSTNNEDLPGFNGVGLYD